MSRNRLIRHNYYNYFIYTLFLIIIIYTFSCGPTKNKPFKKEDRRIRRIAIITVADLQSNLFPSEEVIKRGWKKIKRLIGGIDRISFIANEIRKKVDGALLLSSGDDLMGPFFDMFKGIPEIEAMNMAGYDVVTIGNHEFDLGIKIYAKLAQKAKFNIVSANLEFKDKTISKIIRPYILKQIAHIKIGIFGLITPNLSRISNVGNGVKVKKNIKEISEDIVKKLKNKGADIIIALTHLGSNLDLKLAREINGIDIIVGGHSHEYLYKKIINPNGNTIVVQAGAGGKKIGILEFEYYENKIHNPVWRLIPLDENIGHDLSITEYLKKYKDAFQNQLNRPIGETSVELDAQKKDVRCKESNLGNLITESWIEWFGENEAIALMNGGGIRGDKIYPAGSISYKDLINIHPFGGTVYKVRMTGAELKQVLEISASTIVREGDGCNIENRPSPGGFLQIAGLRVIYALKERPFCAVYDGKDVKKIIHSGKRVQKVWVLSGSDREPLNLQKNYIVLVNSWIAKGGDGYYIFRKIKQKEDTTMSLLDILIFYIKKHTPIRPYTDGRIQIIDSQK